MEERASTEMRDPDLRISSSVWASRLPLGIPNLRLCSIFAIDCDRLLLRCFVMPVTRAVLRRIDQARVHDFPLAFFEHAKIVALVAQMTGGAVALLLDDQQDRV